MRKADPNSIASRFGDLQADYDANKSSRWLRKRTGLAPGGGPADYHIRNEPQYYELIEKARDMDRNDAIVGQVLDRAVDNQIQGGFTLIPTTGDKKLDLDLWQRWKEWSESPELCDLSQEMCFHDYELAAARANHLDGDCVIFGTEEGGLQFHEAHVIGTSKPQANTFLGVTVDQFRRRIQYWVSKDRVGSRSRSNGKEDAQPFAVRDAEGVRQIFHVYHSKRVTLTRGVTSFAPIFAVASMIEDINFAKLVQQQIVSCFAILRERPANATSDLPTGDPYGDQTSEVSPSGSTRLINGIQPGMEVEGKPGEQLKGFAPNIPNSEFFNHFWLEIAILGANLGMAPCQVLLDFSRENFVGYRGAIHEARKGLRRNQANLRKRFHTPVYLWKVMQWIDSDPALARLAQKRKKIDPLGHKWQPPSFEYLEPVADAAGDLLRVRNNLTSRRRLHAERSQDWEEIAEESVKDNSYAIVLALKEAEMVNKQFPNNPIPLTYRDFLPLPTPDGIQVSLNPAQNQQQPPANKGNSSNG